MRFLSGDAGRCERCTKGSLVAASARARNERLEGLQLALAPMDVLPAPSRAFDLVIAHGIWNLARSGEEFRRAVKEAARVAKPGAALFIFTFSRNTLPLTPDRFPANRSCSRSSRANLSAS